MCINRSEFADYMSWLAKVFDVEFQTFEDMKKAALKYSRTTIKSRYHLIACTKVQAVNYLEFLIFDSLALRNVHPVFTVQFSPSATSMATTFFHCSHKGWIYYKQTNFNLKRMHFNRKFAFNIMTMYWH